MITQGMKEAVARHQGDGHKVVEIEGKYGPEWACFSCGKQGVLLAWQIPDMSGLNSKKKLFFSLAIPMRYGVDSDEVDNILLRNGFELVTNANYEQACQAVVAELIARLSPGDSERLLRG